MSRTKGPPHTTRKTLAQVIACVGCCCGRPDKGHPPVPVEWLKAEWRRRMLPKRVHLAISGCLGPCDASNVVMLMFGEHAVVLGGLSEHAHYQELVEWAAACDRSNAVAPLPTSLERFRMRRFVEQGAA